MFGKIRDLYDQPLWKDWLTWLTVLAVIAGISSEILDYDGSNPAATAIGLVLAIGFQFVFWGILPGLIRRWVRSRGD